MKKIGDLLSKNLKLILVFIIVFIFVYGITHVSSVRGDVILTGFTMNETGTTINMEIEVTGSKGYVRKITTESEGEKLYIDFHSTTGVNNETGSKTVFPIRPNDAIREIYFYTWNEGYKKVMVKEDDEWFQYLNFLDSFKGNDNL